jgi:hypothetical protein
MFQARVKAMDNDSDANHYHQFSISIGDTNGFRQYLPGSIHVGEFAFHRFSTSSLTPK